MRFSFWQSILSLVAAGFIGITVAAPSYGQVPTQQLNYDEIDTQNEPGPAAGETHATAAAYGSAEKADLAAGCCHDDCDCIGNWRENTYVWFGGDAFKSLGDAEIFGFAPGPFSHANSFGLVGGFNTGVALGDSRVRGQIGGSFGAYDLKGRLLSPKNDSLEQQTYATFGVYKRSDVSDDDHICWGLVYDTFLAHQWGWAGNEVCLSQIRYRAGYATSECNEFGISGTFQMQDDDDVDITFPIVPELNRVRAKNQLNGYWEHNWDFGGTSTGYVGVFDGADVSSWQFGLLNLVPMSDYASVYANFTYVAPSSATGIFGAAEEQWNVSVGLVYYFGGKAVADTVSGQRGLPLMPVANNGNFLITN